MYPASFALFMSYLSSDHSPCVLTIPDMATRKSRPFRFMNFLADKKEFISVVKENWNVDIEVFAMFRLAKRLKFMKKHMRDLNRKNGDVFDKVKFLRTKLGRVQGCLDKDPSNTSLKEEEMIYAYAFKEVALVEEKLLQQKTKIAWLKDGDFNSSYFHKVVKGRMSRSRIEVIYDDSGNLCHGDDIANIFVSHFSSFLSTQDHVYDVEDANNLFKKRLDANIALDLIKPVNNKEIKDALFNIDDNKTSGPDGSSLRKVISKVITNRLKLVLNGLVDVNQSAFIPVNIQKAYDTRGLRLGDPILPYLFTLVMEVLNLMIKRQVNNDKRFKYHSGCGKLGITSLCFDDDLLLLCYGDLVSASILRRGLDEFSLASSLYPSMSKSDAFFCGLTPEARNEILMAMPFKEVIQSRIKDWKNMNLSFDSRL
ncbi:hypothetical protein Tco_0509389 [Tanacetum coccineum]